ncbi:MAG: FUN14 domain-containing protein [Planctomycetes bacterium]|nr:FUN14 domain-containing protein [Planctomycetota bacterium]
MDREAPGTAPATERGFGQWLRDMPRWKKVSLGIALTTVVVGAVWSLGTGGASGGTGGAGQTGLTAQFQPGGTSPGGAVAEEPAAKGVFRLGFSFLAGFCIGSFIRAALRVVAIAVGFWLLMTVVLSYFGLVVVDWHAIESVWDRFAANVEHEWGNFQQFLTGSLPAAGLAVGGLAIGLKRH